MVLAVVVRILPIEVVAAVDVVPMEVVRDVVEGKGLGPIVMDVLPQHLDCWCRVVSL